MMEMLSGGWSVIGKTLEGGGKMMKNDSMAFSIKTAFNLGVWMRKNQGDKDIFSAGRCLREIIFFNIDQPEEGQHLVEVVNANVDYLLEVALLGYVMSGVCAYDEEIKERIPKLIEKRLVSEVYNDAPENYEGEVSEQDEEEFYTRVKALGMN